MPSASSCPTLAFYGVTSLVASTLTLSLDGLYTAINTTTSFDGETIPTTSRHVATKGGTPTDYVLIVPAATSPMAGKYVIIVAGAAATGPNAAGMLAPDVTAIAKLWIGIWMATAGNTVSAADYVSWSGATVFSGAGTFSGFNSWYGGAIAAKVTALVSDEAVALQLEDTGGAEYTCWAGLTIKAPSDGANSSESGMAGRLFGLGTSGSSGAMIQAFLSAAAGPGYGIGHHSTTNLKAHNHYRVPATSTMRACSWVDAENVTPAAYWTGTPLPMSTDSDGFVDPEPMVLNDVVGTGIRNKVRVGKSRLFFFGARRRSLSVVSDGGTKRWVTLGASSASDSYDCVWMPR